MSANPTNPATSLLLLKPPQAAKVLQISLRALRRLTRSGEIPVVVLGERLNRYDVEALRAWLTRKAADGAIDQNQAG